jgi:hypothetical protein
VAEPLWPVTQAFSTFRFNEGEKNIRSILYSYGDSLNGQSNEIFMNGFLPSLLLGIFRLFESGFEFVEIFAIFD